MARPQPENHCDLWGDTALPGVLLMRADFTSQEFSPHVHDEMVIAVTEAGGAEFDSRGVNDIAEAGTTLVFNPGARARRAVSRASSAPASAAWSTICARTTPRPWCWTT